ncbi:3-hydroxyacyl-CoA dehydrogenase family protein [Desulfosporosinus sp. BICA1-9]|uniref:3-hydroxyacyl-CoA dehydrogenase family protein n=1 Tax=Desulfosporosinus sp. BICA1-9 TaxID=1531958 RepID=UPI00054BAA7F|nr:3-hydroxyacyl-CoA dehydrogenase family protein [Desulfosporosinus sp. BICA1-9]KJS49896.1 MAG: 3-hydroxybutyryl-CoA dehydrogenase [Peptococcaceae bacterium BRH_c23]KJS84228.1 MAG: 3-hydroxybutyryl-CoA dehydrogenase [Desulfosporosinus sp. BICA1-9]HBW37697.1 3-hydroxyacyl-CoA dehydrogenase family protein [Desulfosporosinus sp.]
MTITRVAVVGAGTMGAGIAQVAAQTGHSVNLLDVNESVLARARQVIEQSLLRLEKKGSISAGEGKNVLARITLGSSLEVVSDSDLVIEAVPEQLDLKAKIFRDLDRLAPEQAILASNTSSLPITAIAAVTKRPRNVIGMHFMNPVPVMKGVELIKGRLTSEETISASIEFIKILGKVPFVALDYAGFISSRILNAYLNEAAYTVQDGNNCKDVDDGMVYSTNVPLGPCALMDLVGIDVVVFVLGILEEEFGPKFKAAPLLKQMVNAGQLGRKTGQGFYKY